MKYILFLILFTLIFTQDKVNWNFISLVEEGGKPKLNGYVPNNRGQVIDRSGVTVATGVDLGRSAGEIKSLGLPSSLESKLLPYAGLQGQRALAKIRSSPLSLSASEVATLDKAERSQQMQKVTSHYEKAMGKGSFSKLTGPQQTVLSSISYQWGVYLENTKMRGFWNDVKKGNWDKIQKDLLNDHSKYSNRRHQEGNVLKKR